jgi:hypothetical protein
MRGSELSMCSDGPSNEVSNIIRRHTDNRKLLLICILLLADSFILYRFYFYQYMFVFLFNSVIYVFVLLGLCILIVRLPWLRFFRVIVQLPWLSFFRAFSSVVRQMPGYNSPRRGTARTVSIYFCVVLCIFFCVSFCVLFVCKCVLYYCHRVTTQLQLTNISISVSCAMLTGCWQPVNITHDIYPLLFIQSWSSWRWAPSLLEICRGLLLK